MASHQGDNNFFEIGWFQIENLMLNQMNFVLFDLRRDPAAAPEPKKFWQRVRVVSALQALQQAQAQLTSLAQPLLLMCEDGQTAAAVALELGKHGYSNLFVIEGGYQKLLSDWQQVTNS